MIFPDRDEHDLFAELAELTRMFLQASGEVWCEGFFVNRYGSFTEGDTNDLSRSG